MIKKLLLKKVSILLTIVTLLYRIQLLLMIKMNKFRNIERKYSTSNTVDKDVQSMLLPLDLMQYFSFCPKYYIKSNILYPNSFFSNFVSTIVTLVFFCLNILCAYLHVLNKDSLGHTPFSYFSCQKDCIFYCLVFAMNFVIGVIQTKKHVQFVTTFQKVHRFLKNDTCFKHFIIWNWIHGIIALLFYVFVFSYFVVLLDAPLYSVYNGYLLVVFYFNVIYATRFIKLSKNKVILLNYHVLNSREQENKYKIFFNKNIFEAFTSNYLSVMKSIKFVSSNLLVP